MVRYKLVASCIAWYTTISNRPKGFIKTSYLIWQSDKKKVQKAVEYALECGYRHLDCAYRYLNEEEVGAGIKNKINDKTVKREDIFVTDKVVAANLTDRTFFLISNALSR